MRLFITSFLICCSSYIVLAQDDYGHVFGQIKQSDIDLKKVPFDSLAAAVVLFDIGETRFIKALDGSLDIQFTRTKRIKILDESALDQANFKIYFYQDGYGKTETVEGIQAICYNYENHKLEKTSITKSDILEAQHTDKWKVKKIAVPGAKVGSILELQYKIITPFLWNLPDWEFQSDLPTLSSHYTVGMVPFYEYAVISQNIKRLDKVESYEENSLTRQFGSVQYRDMMYEYGMKNVEAFVDDDFITSRKDYIQKINFQLAQINRTDGTKQKLITTWPEMVKDFNKEDNFGKYIKSSKNFSEKSVLPQLPLTGKTDQEKIQIIAKYVKTNFRLNDYYGKYAEQKPRQLFASKTGSVSEINLFMLGLLRAAGIKANPVLLSTRAHGKIYADYPFTSMFNYVVVQAYIEGDSFIFMDGTEPQLPYYLLPIRCLNGFGLVMEKENHSWINLSSHINSTKKEIAISSIKDGKLNIRLIEQLSMYDAWKTRRLYNSDKSAFKDSRIKENETVDGEINVTNIDTYDAMLTLKYTKNKEVDQFEGDYYIVPFDRIEYAKNPLTSLKRNYPIDLVYKKNRTYSTTLALGEGQSFKHIPENKTYEDDLISFDYQVTITNQFIRVDASYEFKKSVYTPEEYDALKTDFELLYSKLAEQVVITEL